MDPERMESVYADPVDEVPDEATVTAVEGTCLEENEVLQDLFEAASGGSASEPTSDHVSVGTDSASGQALYCAAACLHQHEFSDTPQEYPDGFYVRDGDLVLAFGAHGLD